MGSEGKTLMGKTRKLDLEQVQEITAEALRKALPEEMDLSKMSLMAVLQWGSQEVLKQAVIAEATNYLGRARYEHHGKGEPFKGERNGFRETTIDTPSGQVVYPRQRLAHAPGFKSKLHVPYMRRPEEFAEAITEMYVQGVSTRKVKLALKAVAKKAKLSSSTVSRITQKLRDEFGTWKKRDLSELKVAYLFLDAIRIGMRLENTRKDAVLVAYAVLENGDFELLSIGLGNTESGSVWEKFVADLKLRGLKDPLLTVSDGNQGVIGAIEKYLPTSYRQRCVKHKIDNVLDAIPKEKHDEARPKLNQIFYGSTSLEQAKEALKTFKREYGKIYPSAVARLENDLEQALTFYLFPSAHWKRLRTSNRLERLNLEIRRRLNVIGRHPSEDGCLSLVYGVAERYSVAKRGFKANDLVQALWRRLRNEKLEMLTQLELGLDRVA